MNLLYSPLERHQQFGIPTPSEFQPSRPAGTWNGDNQLACLVRRTGDGITTCPPPPGYTGNTNPLASAAQDMFAGFPGFDQMSRLIQQLIAILQQFIANNTPTENRYADATASSTGDPHLAFDGTQVNGQSTHAHFDSMTSHADLLDSNSFAGGYQISTQVTQPAANGTTMNKSATITSNYGQTSVSLDNTGTGSITANGQSVTIQPGQTLDLGNGETVTKNNDGSITVINVNGQGSTIATTLKASGGGVDITTKAHNTTLGGDLVTQTQNPAQTPPLIDPELYQHPRQPLSQITPPWF